MLGVAFFGGSLDCDYAVIIIAVDIFCHMYSSFCQCIHQLDRTPLIAASGSGFPGVVRILLDRIKCGIDREAHLNAVMEVSYNIMNGAA